jgi:hypothetical protein
MVWKRWSRNKILTKAARLLLVNRMAVAISSHCRGVFIQNSRLMYQCGTCSEKAEQREEDVAKVRGILLTEITE